MKQTEKKILILEIISLIILLLNIIFFRIKNLYLIGIFPLLIQGIIVLISGFEKNRKRLKKDGILLSIIFSLIYLIFIYIFGIFVGYVKNGYSLSIINILKNIIPVIFVIITSELLRFELNQKSEKRNILLVLSAIIFILIDISMFISAYNFNDIKNLIEFGALIILPSITKNILLTYYSLKFGLASNLIYRLILELYIYIIPIIPNLGIYLESTILFVLPILLIVITKKMMEEKKDEDIRNKHIVGNTISTIFIVFMIIIVLFTSGIFKYYFLTIGSGSMTPNINKGDIVLVEKKKDMEISKIKDGEILVFNKENKVIVHRVVKVSHYDDKNIFKTKGDKNKSEDAFSVLDKEVIGVAKARIPLLGYPTVWLNELVGGV